MERPSSNQENEKQYIKTPIEELLPRYYEAHGDNPRYEIVRSIPIDGHEVAWTKYSGHVVYDITGQGQEGKTYEDHGLVCACEFAEGIGWEVKDNGELWDLGERDTCLPRKIALYLRKQELQEEYIERFASDNPFFTDVYGLREHLPAIMLDLMEKDRAGEFIGEGSNGAHFWGGHFYLQTVKEIAEAPWDDVWKAVNKLHDERQIQLEGMVIQDYYEPPAPAWEFYARRRYGDENERSEEFPGDVPNFIIAASLPAHSKMEQVWSYAILDPEGNVIHKKLSNLLGSALTHSPDFGVDVEDVQMAEKEMDDLAETIKRNWAQFRSGLLKASKLVQRDTGGDTDVE